MFCGVFCKTCFCGDSIRWRGCEGLSSTDHNLDSSFLSETSVKESSSTPTVLQALWIGLLNLLLHLNLHSLRGFLNFIFTFFSCFQLKSFPNKDGI